jgi:hypothetical protein
MTWPYEAIWSEFAWDLHIHQLVVFTSSWIVRLRIYNVVESCSHSKKREVQSWWIYDRDQGF